MAVSWVTGTTNVNTGAGTSSSLAVAAPSGIQNDTDTLLALVVARSAVTAPSGWSLVESETAVSGADTVFSYVFKKNLATSNDSGVAFTFAQSSNLYMSVSYGLLRSNLSREPLVVQTAKTQISNTSATSITPSSLTATRNGEMIVVSYATINGNTTAATAGSNTGGLTVWTGSVTYNRNVGAYIARNAGQSNTGTFTVSGVGAGGMTAITLRITDGIATADVVDTISSADTTGVSWDLTTEVIDTVDLLYSTNLGKDYAESISDSIEITDALLTRMFGTLLDTVGVAPAPTQYTRILREIEDYIDSAAVVRATPVLNLADTISGADTVLGAYRPGAAIVDRPRIVDLTAAKGTYLTTTSDVLRLVDLLRVGTPVALGDTIVGADALTVVRASTIIERLRLTDALLGKGTFGLTQSETIRLADTLRRFFGGDLSDTIGGADALLPRWASTRILGDTIGVAETVTPRLVLRITSADTLSLTDAQVLTMAFRPVLTDEVQISAAYVSPNNTITTWAVNTRTGAVTEYTNYEFNSFAQLGRTFLAASEDGLYALDGDDDAGDDIIADIKSGLFQMGGSRFTSFKAAYLGMRGEGEFFLKLVEGDGVSRTYRVVGQTMETTKVWLGKGLRSRYYSFELVSTGQDFDLDSIEFIPVVSQRRV
jgi:hypothetical protein